MNPSIAVLFIVPFLAYLPISVDAQLSADHVVINELDTNPSLDLSGPTFGWVELYNPTSGMMDIGDWEIISATTEISLSVPTGTTLKPNEFMIFSHNTAWFTNIDETVELHDSNGVVIDATPQLTDLHNNALSWQRIHDGHDLDSDDDWRFAQSVPGESNSKTYLKETGVTVSIVSDKDTYTMGETAKLEGRVSEQIFKMSPFLSPEPIILTVSGPAYHHTELFYPDRNNSFETTVKIHKVLGIDVGNYNVFVSYAGATSQTTFVINTIVPIIPESHKDTLLLSTDKTEYVPGQTVKIAGQVSTVIPFEGLVFRVSDPLGNLVASGNLFPTGNKFSTTVFLTSLQPVYGTYEIFGMYSEQSYTASFDLVSNTKDDATISLQTDRKVYGLGDTVKITGSLNTHWIQALNLEISQTKNIALGVSSIPSGGTVLKILDAVRLDGDGSFKYEFTIPRGTDRLGDYIIKVSGDIGSIIKSFTVSEHPDTYVSPSGSLMLVTDSLSYELNDTMVIIGKIPDSALHFGTSVVNLTIRDDDGSAIGVKFTAIPDQSGRFSFEIPVSNSLYDAGSHTVEVTYQNLSQSATIEFTDIIGERGFFITTDKQIYGLSDTVSLTGVLPHTGENTVVISLTKPGGTIINSGTRVDNQKFTWTWPTPTFATPTSFKSTNDRSIIASNLGVYKITATNGAFSDTVFFTVSANPDADVTHKPLILSTAKSSYMAGEKLLVTGYVLQKDRGDQGLSIPPAVKITILPGKLYGAPIFEASVYPDPGGNFKSQFDLPPAIFAEGQYMARATYANMSAESSFDVINEFAIGVVGDVDLILSTDKQTYNLGDLVTVTGKLSRIIHLDKFDVSVTKKSEHEITCGSIICGKHLGPVTNIPPSPSGSFTYEYMIGDTPSDAGFYEIIVDAGFDTKSILFEVIPKPSIEVPESESYTVIEKFNRIPDSHTVIQVSTKISENGDALHPRVLSGSVVTPSASDQPHVNLAVYTASGKCVIGPDPECAVSESTRTSDGIYSTVEVDGTILNVLYTGSDVRLEKFDIASVTPAKYLPDSTWQIQILKDEQISRLYYKLNYMAIP